MRLLVGLGNPGAEYAGTRHNVGFELLDRVARRRDLRWLRRGRAEIARRADAPLVLAKPQTFMNLSGRAVRDLVADLGPALELLVACDDFHLPLGRLRCRAQGSSGGQKGLQSILEALPGLEVPRLRLGVGEPVGVPAEDYVLQPFRRGERPVVDAMLERAEPLLLDWLVDGDLDRLIRGANGEAG